MQNITLNTGVWYDRQIELPVPSSWDVTVLWPNTPEPLTSEQLAAALASPVGMPGLTELCRGKARPMIIVDDMNRPTPVSAVMPLVLESICAAGIALENITILMATGTHGGPLPEGMLQKVGEAAKGCRLLVHDCFKDAVHIGETRHGTPVYVNKAVAECDVVIGISGISPNSTTGYGGGSKLALGVLGIRSLYSLHFHQHDIGWGNAHTDIHFRHELDEIAAMIGMRMQVSLVIDARRQVIRLYCGDQKQYFPEAVDFYRRTFTTREPAGPFDVVISNAYPNDPSLTFAAKKGIWPLEGRQPNVSRIAIAACEEGLGLHNIWPYVNVPRLHKYMHRLRVLSVMSLKELWARGGGALWRRVKRRLRRRGAVQGGAAAGHPIWMLHTGKRGAPLPEHAPGMNIAREWDKIVAAVTQEQGGCEDLKVVVYPCAFLQVGETRD